MYYGEFENREWKKINISLNVGRGQLIIRIVCALLLVNSCVLDESVLTRL